MDLTQAMQLAASGMKVQGARLRLVAQNLANAESTALAPGGEPYRRQTITYPIHLAVALRYEAARRATPKVVAKGQGVLAERIRAIARAHGVPVIANPPLARALHAAVALDAEIPAAHYRAVAEVIGYVLRARTRH